MINTDCNNIALTSVHTTSVMLRYDCEPGIVYYSANQLFVYYNFVIVYYSNVLILRVLHVLIIYYNKNII